MTAVYHKSRRGLDNIDEDLSAEGMSIMLSQPSWMVRMVLLLVFSLLVVGLAYSFYRKAPVVVSVQGTVSPEQEQDRVYVPIKGELVELYVTEGQPVRKGDTIARLNSLDAIRLAGQADIAQLALLNAQRAFDAFPAKREAMSVKLALLEEQIRANEAEYEKLSAEGMAKLGEEQRLKLAKARAKLEKAQEQERRAWEEYQRYKRLNESETGGGISAAQVRTKEKDYMEKGHDVRVAETELGEFEIKLGQEYAKRQEDLQKKLENLMSTRQQRQDQIIAMQEEERKIRMQLQKSQDEAAVADRIRFEDIDDDNFLRIRSPSNGVVTQIPQTQVGAQITEKTPIVVLAPDNARKILEVKIPESDSGLLELGMPVKLKFNPFPYQRYGFIEGTLEFIGEVAYFDRDMKKMVYKGRIGLDKDEFDTSEGVRPIRYGMGASAEVVVRNRRLVDVALDPIRKITTS